MYSDWIDRLTRVKWSSFGELGVDMLAEEVATLFGQNHSLTQRGNLTVKGNLIAEGGVNGMASYAKATANWVNNGANSYVLCKKASKRDGTLVEPPVNVTVYLPPGAGKDPNVRTGQIIQYMTDANGDAVVIGGSYLDDKIGTTKIWATGSIPAGWALMNGSANASGSGIDMTDKFARGGSTSGGTGGNNRHDHDGATEEATTGISADLSGLTVDSATTGISLNDHLAADTEHDHEIQQSPIEVQSGSGISVGVSTTATEISGPGDLTHNVNDPGHTHTVSGSGGSLDDPGHEHTIGEADNIPEYVTLAFIERIN